MSIHRAFQARAREALLHDVTKARQKETKSRAAVIGAERSARILILTSKHRRQEEEEISHVSIHRRSGSGRADDIRRRVRGRRLDAQRLFHRSARDEQLGLLAKLRRRLVLLERRWFRPSRSLEPFRLGELRRRLLQCQRPRLWSARPLL
jgi:hypothetical protein